MRYKNSHFTYFYLRFLTHFIYSAVFCKSITYARHSTQISVLFVSYRYIISLGLSTLRKN